MSFSIVSDRTGEMFVGAVPTGTGTRGWVRWEAQAVLAVRPWWLDECPYEIREVLD